MPIDLLKEKRNKNQSGPRDLLAERKSKPKAAQPRSEKPSMIGSVLSGVGNLGLGLTEGAAQGTYNMLKSAGNLGLDAIESMGNSRLLQNSIGGDSDFDEWNSARNPEENQGGQPITNPYNMLAGSSEHEMGRIPQMQIQQENPQSSLRSAGQFVGNMAPSIGLAATLGPLGAPAGEYAASAMGLSQSPLSMMIARALGSAGAGAAEGYVTGPENSRGASAAFGGGAAGLSQLGGDLLKARSSSIAKNVKEKVKSLQDSYGKQFEAVLLEAEEAGANASLKPIKGNSHAIIENSSHSKLSNALGDFQKNPTLSNAHKAQSDLGAILRNEKAAGSKAYEEAGKAQNRLLQQISQALEDSGSSDAKAAYEGLRTGYAKEVAPYLNAESTKDLISGILSESWFAGEAVKDKNLLTQIGKNHPDLLLRKSLGDLGNAALKVGSIAAPLKIASDGYNYLNKNI